MNIKRISLLLLGISLFCGTALVAQDFKQALQDMRKAYEEAEQMHIEMDAQVFEEIGTSQPYYQETVEISKDGVNFLYKYGSNEMLMNEQYLIMVDKNAREIALNKRHLKEEAKMQEFVQFDMDSILNFYETPEFLGKENGNSHFRISQKKGPVAQVDLFLNDQTKMLNKMEYRYHEGQFVSILFKAFDLNPTFRNGAFHESQYIIKENESLKASAFFRGYKVLETESY